MLLYWMLITLGSYIIGSIPFGAIISRRIANIDITRRGSGNIGATNVARELGLRWGIITLVLDLLKGFMPIYIFCRYFDPYVEYGIIIVSLSTLFGHQFSFFKRFHGGKGVATALGIFFALSPVSAIIALCLFIITVYRSNFVSLGSMVATSTMPLILWFSGGSKNLILTSLIMAALICLKHKENIQRMLQGKERIWRKTPSCQKINKAI